MFVWLYFSLFARQKTHSIETHILLILMAQLPVSYKKRLMRRTEYSWSNTFNANFELTQTVVGCCLLLGLIGWMEDTLSESLTKMISSLAQHRCSATSISRVTYATWWMAVGSLFTVGSLGDSNSFSGRRWRRTSSQWGDKRRDYK